MKKTTYILSLLLLAGIAAGIQSQPPVATNDVPAQKPATISVFEMIETGPPQLKMHALAMITQGSTPPIEDEHFKSFVVSAKDSNVPIRSLTARIVGGRWVAKDKEQKPEAIDLLIQLAKDESMDVRISAVHYGLVNVTDKSDGVIQTLIDVASESRDNDVVRIIKGGLEKDQPKVISLLNERMADKDASKAIVAFEMFEDLSGSEVSDGDRFLEMPSSRPMLFIFSDTQDDAEAVLTEVLSTLKEAGVENPDLSLAGPKAQQIVMLKTRLTKERLLAKKLFSGDGENHFSQMFWLTPQLEIQMDAMRAQAE